MQEEVNRGTEFLKVQQGNAQQDYFLQLFDFSFDLHSLQSSPLFGLDACES